MRCGGGGGSDNPPGATAPTAVVQPLPLPGPFAVACSNVVQDFSRLGAGEDVQGYWEGAPSSTGVPRYATDLLADPGNTLIATVAAPQDANLYGSFAGDNVAFVVLACYPTDGQQPPSRLSAVDRPVRSCRTCRPDRIRRYLRTTRPVIRWLRFRTATAAARSPATTFRRCPFSRVTGTSSSPRFTVTCAFPTSGSIDLSDVIALLSHLSDFTALQALRPLSISAALDLVLGHPQWQGHIDATRIGGFGASMGGETMMLMGGAGLTTSSAGLSWNQVTRDPRIKAAVGYVPYFGQPFLPCLRTRPARARRRRSAVPRHQRDGGHDRSDRPKRRSACRASPGPAGWLHSQA